MKSSIYQYFRIRERFLLPPAKSHSIADFYKSAITPSPIINIANIEIVMLQTMWGIGLILIKGNMMNESTSNPSDSEISDASNPY